MNKDKVIDAIISEVYLEKLETKEKINQIKTEMKAWKIFQEDINTFKLYKGSNNDRGGIPESYEKKLADVSKLISNFKKQKEDLVINFKIEEPLLADARPMSDFYNIMVSVGENILETAKVFGYNIIAKRANAVYLSMKYLQRLDLLEKDINSFNGKALISDLRVIFTDLLNKYNSF